VALSFPNRSRSYDSRGHRVRFWGHDGAFEVSFFMEQRALFRLSPDTNPDEAGLLSVFDRYRDRIMAAAMKVYAGRRKDAYTLLASDF
jgi:hypothetical protein